MFLSLKVVGIGLAGLMLVAGVLFWQKGKGIFGLWRFMEARKERFEQKKGEGVSIQERQALEVVLETCSSYRKNNFSSEEDFRFVPDTLRLISQIASIYYPGENEPMEKARIGNVLSAFQEMNGKILTMLELPGLEKLTQFRLREVLPGFESSKKSSRSFIKHRVRLMVMRGLWAQWVLLVGEAAIKVYGEHQTDEAFEPEALMDEMDQLQDEMNLSLPDEVRVIVETSRKKILFSLKPLSSAEMKSLYKSLAENIALFWHPESSAPIYEVRVYDLLKSLAGYLEWAGNLSQKPVLNKMLGLRLSHLIGVRDMAKPFTENKLFDWIQKYQMDRAAKWSKTIYKTLQKKQPAILLRDVAIGVVKEGGKRWLVLVLHDKIAEETNKLYSPPTGRGAS
jgi:hypothetical protein